MTRRQRITARLEAEAAKSAPMGYGGWINAGPAFTDAFRSRRAPAPAELVEAYKSIAYACAQINAGAVVRTPLRLYATTASGQATPKGYRVGPGTPQSRERMRRLATRPAVQKYLTKAERVDEIADHPLLQVLVNPNPDFDQTSLIRLTCLYLDVVGSAFWVPEAFKLGYPTEMWPIQSQYVNPLRDANTLRVRAWQYFGTQYPADEVVHFRIAGLKDPYGKGYGPLQAAFEHARIHDSYTSVQESLLGTGAKMTVVISPKDPAQPMGEPERARFEADANRRFSGQNAGRVFVTDGSIDVNPVTWPPSDLAAMQISDDALERFANCFGVPLALLQTESVNLANLEASKQQHAAMAVEPRCIEIAGALTRWMHSAGKQLRSTEGKDRGWDRLFWAFDDPVGEDLERKTRVYDLQAKAGIRTINEIRTEMGEPPVAWGDEPWLPTALSQPSGDQRKPPPAPIAPAPPAARPDAPEVPEDGEPGDAEAEKSYRAEREDGIDPFRATKSPPRIQAGGAEDNDDEQGEDNTFDLPDGRPLTAAMRAWYARQLKAVLGKVPPRFEEIPLGPGFFDLSSYDSPMGEAMTPLLALYWDAAGRSMREAIGLDPAEWRVTDPNLAATIRESTFAFCASTNGSTSDTLTRAHERLRDQLRRGVLDEGEALGRLTERVKQVYATLSDSHAELIAITETNRAVHQASLRSAQESGVVAGKRPLISQNACPLCHKIVDEVNEKGSIGLDDDFAVVGSNPLYSHMKVPPFHPRCRCSYVTVLTPEYEALIPADSPYWQNAGKAVPPKVEAKVEAGLKRAPKVEKAARGESKPITIKDAMEAIAPKPKKKKPDISPAPARDFADDPKGAEEWGQAAFKDQFARLTEQEKDAIHEYTQSSSEINAAMRGRAVGSDETVRTIRNAVAGLKKMAVPEAVTAFRGVRDELAAELKQLDVGADFAQYSFCSTSLVRSVAEGFANTQWSSSNVVMKIRVPAGANGLYVNAGGPKYSAFEREKELLLPYGATFRVLGKADRFDHTEIEVELVPGG